MTEHAIVLRAIRKVAGAHANEHPALSAIYDAAHSVLAPECAGSAERIVEVLREAAA